MTEYQQARIDAAAAAIKNAVITGLFYEPKEDDSFIRYAKIALEAADSVQCSQPHHPTTAAERVKK